MCVIMSIEYKVPRLLWENFESVLLAQSKRYIGELAKILGVPERELLKKILPTSDSLKVIIQDTQSESNQCNAYIQNDKLTVFCRKPVSYGCEYCTFHRNKRMLVIGGGNPIHIQRIKDSNKTEPLWVSNNTLHNSSGDIVGKINREECTIKIFMTGA